MKTIAIRGIKGYIGSLLKDYFLKRGFNVIAIERNDIYSIGILKEKLKHCDYIINLSGYNAFSLWTKANKRKIVKSRVDYTRDLVSALIRIKSKIHLINASAIGIYLNNVVNDEYSTNYAINFLANVVKNWEEEVCKYPFNYTICRFGIVIGKHSEILKKLVLPLRFGFYPRLKNFNFEVSAIAEDELQSAIQYVIDTKLTGVVNICQPQHTNINELYNTLSSYYKLLFKATINYKLIKFLLTERLKVLVNGPAVIPKVLINSGYVFKYNNITEKLNSIYRE